MEVAKLVVIKLTETALYSFNIVDHNEFHLFLIPLQDALKPST